MRCQYRAQCTTVTAGAERTCFLCNRAHDEPTPSNCCSREPLPSCSTFGKAICFQPLMTKQGKTQSKDKRHMCSRAGVNTDPLVCDGDLVGLARGLAFRRYVRGATDVHDLELYARMSGIAELFLLWCAVQVSQGVQDQLSIFSSGSLPTAPTRTVRTSGCALHCCGKNAFNSMCLVLRVEPLRWIMLMAAVESQQSICDRDWFGSTVPVPQLSQSHSFERSR